ncbi:MAG: LamG-like jellyroll fold domain-containing protein [Crocinitomicaceae bacterium]
MKTLFYSFLLTISILFSISSFSQNVGLSFDGVDDYVSTSYGGISGSAARTIEAWIKTTANTVPTAGGVQNVIADYGTFTTGARFTFCVLWGNAIRVEIGGSGLSGSIVVNDGQWHHVACVYDPTATDKYALYVDGFLDVAGNLTTVINTGTVNDFRIGQRVDGINEFNGEIDEVRFFDYARSATDIANELNAEYCVIPSGLVAYYRFNDGVANVSNPGLNTATDDSGNGNPGTLNTFTLSGTISNWIVGPVITPGLNGSSIAINTCSVYTSSNGTVYNSSGTYYETYTNSAGCDSIVELKLVINYPTSSINANACNSYTSPSGNYTYTGTGLYYDTLQTTAGCDSVIAINLTIDSYEGTEVVSGCGSYTTPDGNQTFTSSGIFPITYTNVANCDSIVNYDVTIGGPTTSSISVTTCNSYTTPSGNNTYTSTGTYTDVIPNTFGCDSTITIDLTIVFVSNGVSQNGFTLTADLNGATYQWFTCVNGAFDSPIAGETAQSYTPTATGDYGVEVSVGNCTTPSACYTVDFGSVSSSSVASAKIYPNPSSGNFSITLPAIESSIELRIIDLQGKILVKNNLTATNKILINEKLRSGIYFVQLEADKKTATYKVVVM